MSPPRENVTPFIAPDKKLREITVRAVILGAALSILLAGANAYLGLLAGMTVSASIPAAVVSMAILKAFRNANILENNLVQTSASAGESLAAGAIFTFPALVMMGTWSGFPYAKTAFMAALGGVIGVLFTIPLRRALIVKSSLTFPEGVATAEVLKAGDSGVGIKRLAQGGLAGALFKFGETGLGLWPTVAEGARQVGSSIAYFGINLLPSLVGVGFIVGFNIAILVFLGGALNWLVAIPLYAALNPWPEGMISSEFAWWIWSNKTRYLGVGAMMGGGLWTLIKLLHSLRLSLKQSLLEASQTTTDTIALRTAQEVPLRGVLLGLLLCLIPLFFFLYAITDHLAAALALTLILTISGFLFSAVAAYMAGLVGSSNNPVSGVTIATILTSAFLLLLFLGAESGVGPAGAIMVGAVVCCAAAIGGDNMQDLKAGQLLGATPWKQQGMQFIGVLAAALAIAPILNLLHQAYGFGEGAALMAPQAALMQSVAEGVFAKNLPWGIVCGGMGIAGVVIALDEWLGKRGATFRTPVLAVAVGIYLPLELGSAILIGGLIAIATAQNQNRRKDIHDAEPGGRSKALLFAAGLITGEALLGILLAIPIVLAKGSNKLRLFETPPAGGLTAGILLFAGVGLWLYTLALDRGSDGNKNDA